MDRTGPDGQDLANARLRRVSSGHGLGSGLAGLNVVLFGAALVAGGVFQPAGLPQAPELLLLVLVGLSLLWMLWFLIWSHRQPGPPPHTDHHAGSATIKVVLVLFSGFSVLLCVFRMGSLLVLAGCQPLVKILSPFVQMPFFTLQTYLLWTHSKDCIHKHKLLNRYGLMMVLCTDVLLWFCAVTDDSVHTEMELEKQDPDLLNSTLAPPVAGQESASLCRCSASVACAALRRGYQILYPFNMEFSLLAGCMLFVMWRNVGRRPSPVHTEHAQRSSLRSVRRSVLLGPCLGSLVLVSGAAVFVLYHLWVVQDARRLTAFLLFYCFHLGLMPVAALSSLAGLMLQKGEVQNQAEQQGGPTPTLEPGEGPRAPAGRVDVRGGGGNPTQRLDKALLLGTSLGQLSLSYLSFVSALALGPAHLLSLLDLSYSLLCLLEMLLQNVFIITTLRLAHLHTHSGIKIHKEDKSAFSKTGKEMDDASQEAKDRTETPAGEEGASPDHRRRRVVQEICAFLVLSNITLWVMPAFGAHPELETGLGRQFFGFSIWFVLVNLSQPLTVFYRMHSVGALMEMLLSS